MRKFLHIFYYLFLYVVILFPVKALQAQEQILLGWQFYNTETLQSTQGNEETIGSTNTHTGLNSASISRGAAFKPYVQVRSFGSQPYAPILDSVGAVQQGAFYQFNFKPTGTHNYLLSKLNFKIRLTGTWASTLADKNLYCRWQYSIDGGQTFNNVGDKFLFSAATNGEGQLQTPIDLSKENRLQNIGSQTEVIFRLYSWGFSNATGGAYAIGKTPSGTNDYSLSLTGTALTLSPINSEIQEAYFTDQNAIARGAASETIIDKLIQNINQTPAGEHIHMSIYMISHQGVLDALKAAEGRGVNLHIIVDMSRSDSQVTNAESLPWLQANLPGSEVIVCVNDVSANAINHHKFALFSKILTTAGVLSNVTFQTSHNFTVSDTKKIQDALVFNNSDVYQAFLNNWQTIKNLSASGMRANYAFNTFEDVSKGLQLEFFPRILGGNYDGEDNIVDKLNQITDVANARIRIAMSDWSDSRPAIVNKLIELRNQGATIEVYAKDAAGTQTKVRLNQLQQLGATVRIFNLGEGSAAKFNIHAKMMLIEGTWKGQANSNIIVTGSHNYTDGALKTNNEVLVTLLNSSLFIQYSAYFENFKTITPAIPIIQFDLKSIDLTSGNNSNVATFNSTVNPGGIINALVSRGAGLKANTGLSEGFSSSHVYAYTPTTESTFADAFSRDEFIQVQFQTKNSVKASLNKIEWILRKSSLTVPTHYRWYYSINSTNKEDFKAIGQEDQVFIHHQTAAVQQDIDLVNVSDLQDIAENTTVYLRLYISGAINTSSSFGFRNLDGQPGFNLVGDVDRVLNGNLLGWDFSTINNGSRTDGNEVVLTSNISNNNLLPSKLKRGAGLNVNDASVTLQRGFTSVSSNVTTTLEEAEINHNYFTFDVTPKANVSVSLSKLNVNLRRSSAGGNTYIWKYKINDGALVSIGSATSFTSTNTNGVYQPVVNLSSIPELQNVVADSIVFRLYVWGFNTANAGTFAIGRSADSYDLALQINGTATLNPLPVSLTKFEAEKNNNFVSVLWQTASEQSSSHFEVLKSVDGKNWTLLTTVTGSGDSKQFVNYSVSDLYPAYGVNYYQLRQVDFDGTATLSKVASVNFTFQEKESLKVHYSNSLLTLFINKSSAEQSEILVYDLAGRKIISQKVGVNGGNTIINLPAMLNNGIYIVKLRGATSVLTKKFTTN